MNRNLTLQESMQVMDSALRQGHSIIDLVTIQTGITLQHIAILADELLNKLKATTHELTKLKGLTGNTKTPIERTLSKALVLFLFELKKAGGQCHYNDIRQMVKEKYDAICNDYSTLEFGWRLIEKGQGNGFWKITERGKAFLSGELKLAEKVTIQNKQVIQASTTTKTVHDFIEFKDYSVSDRLIEKRKDGLSLLY